MRRKTLYAIIKSGGHQYRVAPGDTIQVEQVDAQPGSQVELGEVLLVGGENGIEIGTPTVSGARVIATVLASRKGPKLTVFKFKPKKRYRRKTGHRQTLTTLSIKEIAR